MLRKFNGPETLRFWEFKGPKTSKSCTILVLSCTLSCVVVEVGVGLWHLLDLHPEAWIMILVWIVLWLKLGLGCDITFSSFKTNPFRQKTSFLAKSLLKWANFTEAYWTKFTLPKINSITVCLFVCLLMWWAGNSFVPLSDCPGSMGIILKNV